MSKLLFIAKGMPNNIKSAGDIRALNALRILRTKFDDITVIASSADYGLGDVKGVGCKAILTHSIKEALLNNPDVIILSHWTIADRYLNEILATSKAKIIIDSIDIEFLRLQRMFDYDNKIIDQAKVDSTKNKELSTYKKAHKIIVASEPDKEELLKHGNFDTTYLPCLFNINNNQVNLSNNNAYIICNWYHRPNIEATSYLCKEIIPHVDVKFHIVGKHPPIEIQKLASDKIFIKGVEYNIEKFLNSMSICLAPTLYGAGINGKIGQALAFGIPVITNTLGALPYNLEHKKSVMIGDTSKDFIDCVKSVLLDSFLRKQLSDSGKEMMKQYTLEYWKNKFLESL